MLLGTTMSTTGSHVPFSRPKSYCMGREAAGVFGSGLKVSPSAAMFHSFTRRFCP